MHILLCASHAESLINFHGPFIRDLQAAGHRVSASAPQISSNVRQWLTEIGVNVYSTNLVRNNTNVIGDLRYLVAMISLLREIKPDLLLTYTIKPNIWGAFAARIAGCRSVAMITGLGYFFTDLGETRIRQRVVGRLVRILYRQAATYNWKLIFLNVDDRESFVAAGCLPDRSKTVMMKGTGIDLKHYVPVPLPESPTFLMIARLLRAKGVREYAIAAADVKRKYPKAKFYLLGARDTGPDALSSNEFEMLLKQGVEWLGEATDIRPHMESARIYVLPSYREGTPRSTLEAMAMGRPVITTDAPGCRETVIDGENGFLVPVRDPNALARAMVQLINEPGLCEEMGRASLTLARDRFEVGAVNAELMRDLGIPSLQPGESQLAPKL